METDMPCPKDGTAYIEIGDQRVCPKCGHTAGYKQVDIVQILKDNEQLKERIKELENLLKLHRIEF